MNSVLRRSMPTWLRCRLQTWLVPAALLVLITRPLIGDEPPGELAARIAAFVAQLDGPSLPVREAAEKELLEIGAAALPALKTAQDAANIEIRLRAAAIAARINERRIAEADIHVVGVYEAGAADGTVVVRIDSAARPVVLVVCAYDSVQWEIRASEQIELLKVIASGFYPQKVTGTSAAVQFLSSEGDHPPKIRNQAFYAYRSSGVRYELMRQRVKELIGKEPASFQGRYDGEGKPFVIGQAK